MIPFELAQPETLAEALELLDPEDESIRVVSGGTALMLMMKAGVYRPSRLVSLRRVADLSSTIDVASDGLRVGGMTTLASLQLSPKVARHQPMLAKALVTLSNRRVRNVATVGGALAHGDPHMDLPPVLTALGGSVVVAGPSGRREIALEDFFLGYYQTALERDELIVEARIPFQAPRKAAYLKVTTGSADDWPALGIAAVLDMDGRLVRSARLVAGAATDRITRLPAAEAVLAGKAVDDSLLVQAGDAAIADCEILADLRGSVAYKRELMRVYIGRAIRSALAQAEVQP